MKKSQRTTARREWAALKRQLKQHLVVLGACLGIMWSVEIVDQVALGGALDALGIRPRSVEQLWGVLTAPWLHGGFPHLVSNTVPFLVLGWLVLNRSPKQFAAASAVIILASGALTWLFAATNSVHIGASGWVFGLFSYLLVAGWYDRKLGSILVAVLVVFVYGSSILFGVVPREDGISWEMHLFGFLGGILAAKLFARRFVPRK